MISPVTPHNPALNPELGSGAYLRNLSTTADNLLSRPDLTDRFVSRSVATLSTAETLATQQTPLDLLRNSDAVIDQYSALGNSSKSPLLRLSELSYIPGAAVAPATLRTVTTLAGQSGPQPLASSEVNHKIVQLTLEQDSELAGSKNQMRYYLSASGQQAGQPLEPSQPPVKSPVGSMSNTQTGLEIRSLQQVIPKLAELTIGPETDSGMQTLNALDGIQRDRIATLGTPMAGFPIPGNAKPESYA